MECKKETRPGRCVFVDNDALYGQKPGTALGCRWLRWQSMLKIENADKLPMVTTRGLAKGRPITRFFLSETDLRHPRTIHTPSRGMRGSPLLTHRLDLSSGCARLQGSSFNVEDSVMEASCQRGLHTFRDADVMPYDEGIEGNRRTSSKCTILSSTRLVRLLKSNM